MTDAQKRDALFFGEYLALLLVALGWLQLEHVRSRVGDDMGLLYLVDMTAIAYVLVRAWLVMGRKVGPAVEPVFLVVDLAVISAFVRLTGGIASEAGLAYLWPLASCTSARAPGRVVYVGLLIGVFYLAATWPEVTVAEYAARLAVRLLVLVLVVALAYSHTRAEATRQEEITRLREQVAVADFRTRLLHQMRDETEEYLAAVEAQLDEAARAAESEPERAGAVLAGLRESLHRTAGDLQTLARRVRTPGD